MELIILGLKRKKDGQHFVFDVDYNGKKTAKKHTPISLKETKTINILSPYPFQHFSSLDDDYVDFNVYDKCYLKVEADLTEDEYAGMHHSSISTHRFPNRKITFISEFENIFQYAFQKLNEFGEKLGTYDLTTWIIHNKTKSAAEYEAMKKILFKSVQNKKRNKLYPLCIHLDVYTAVYASYLRELSTFGYQVKFEYYGSKPVGENDLSEISFDAATFIFLLKELHMYNPSLFNHPMFTKEFYYNHIFNQDFEGQFLSHLYGEHLSDLFNKGIDPDDIYKSFFNFKNKYFHSSWWDYNSLEELFSDDNFPVVIEHHSPYDYYCCEDCDGYDIHEMYDEEDLMGEDVEIDERLDFLKDFLSDWENHLTGKSYDLFNFISDSVLEKYQSHSPFLKNMHAYRIDKKRT